MGTELQALDISLKAAADLSALQFRIMKISAARTINKATAATDEMIGILQDKPAAAGRVGTVRVGGLSKLESGGTISAGAPVTSDANGKGVASAPSSANESIIGWAIEAAVSGDIFTVLLGPGHHTG